MSLSQVTVYTDQIAAQRIGYQAISLTHFGDTAEPQIAQGSEVEIGGALFEAAANESISGWAGISNDTKAYIKLVVSGATATAEFTDTAPSWDTEKQGWYAGDDRYIAKLYKDGSGNYTKKELLEEQVKDLAPRVAVFTADDSFTVPTGIYRLKVMACGGGGGGGGAGGTPSNGDAGGETTVVNAAKGVSIESGIAGGGQHPASNYGFGGAVFSSGISGEDYYIKGQNGEHALKITGSGKGGYGGGSHFGGTTQQPRSPGTPFAGRDGDGGSGTGSGEHGAGGSGAQIADEGAGGGAGGNTAIKHLRVEPGDVLTITIGQGGAGGSGSYAGGDGAAGIVVIEY